MKRTGSIGSSVGGLREEVLDGGGDGLGLAHASAPDLAAGKVARVRSEHGDAVGAEARDVAPGRGVVPHLRVHRRADHHRLVGRQQHGGGKVVGKARGHLCDQVGGRRRDDHEIGLARQPDVAHLGLVGQREELGEDLVAGKRRGGQGRDELLGAVGHDAAHGGLPLPQRADQLQRAVGGDAAGDDEQDALALEHVGPFGGRRPALVRCTI
jgi:hypothetical protein